MIITPVGKRASCLQKQDSPPAESIYVSGYIISLLTERRREFT